MRAAQFRSATSVSVLLLSAALGVAYSQQSVASKYAVLGKESDTYAIPQADHLVVFSLGYRSALADLLFGRTMVDVGIHFVERRVFEQLGAYLYAIIALDPKYRDLYHYADTMLNLSTVEMPIENLRIARDIQERGLKEYPDDAELWMSAGMFVAYVAPQRLGDNEDKSEWKAAGATMIQRACDIWPKNETTPPACFTSVRLFEKVGQNEAAIASTERLLALTDDPETRAKAMAYLSGLMGQREARKREQLANKMSDLQARDLPGVSRTEYQLMLPRTNVRDCAGIRVPWARRECESSYAQLTSGESAPTD